jgi:uncharacterized protein involved in cysteine biosynthesis
MNAAVAALARALPQLADGRILRVLARSVLITLALFVLLGVAGWYALSQALAGWNTGYEAELGALVAVLATVIGGWLLFRLVALAVLQFFAEEIVEAVEERHYPAARDSLRTRTAREDLATSARSTARALLVNLAVLPIALVLLVTGVGSALLFWVVNAWLLGRELIEMVWLRHRTGLTDPSPVGPLSRFALGGFVAALMAVPVVNLVVPVLGAAAATHLVHRRQKVLPGA